MSTKTITNNLSTTINQHKILDLIGSALSGTTGGALIGSSFGLIGGIIGGFVGAFFTGYSGYKSQRRIIMNEKAKI